MSGFVSNARTEAECLVFDHWMRMLIDHAEAVEEAVQQLNEITLAVPDEERGELTQLSDIAVTLEMAASTLKLNIDMWTVKQ